MPDVRVVLAESEGPRSVMYGESAYVAFLAFRTRILIAILEAGIGVWITEADAVWFSSPFGDEDTTADLTTADDNPPDGKISSGMMFLRATPASLAFLAAMLTWQEKVVETNSCRPGVHKKFCDEAQFMSKNRAAGLNIAWLPVERYVSGRWYSEPKLRSGREAVIQNNFLVGTEEKIRRARDFGHWFLDSEDSCVGAASQAILDRHKF